MLLFLVLPLGQLQLIELGNLHKNSTTHDFGNSSFRPTKYTNSYSENLRTFLSNTTVNSDIFPEKDSTQAQRKLSRSSANQEQNIPTNQPTKNPTPDPKQAVYLVRCSNDGPSFWCRSCYLANLCATIIPAALHICRLPNCSDSQGGTHGISLPDNSAIAPPSIELESYLHAEVGDSVSFVCRATGTAESPVAGIFRGSQNKTETGEINAEETAGFSSDDPWLYHSYTDHETAFHSSGRVRISTSDIRHKIYIPQTILDPSFNRQLERLNALYDRHEQTRSDLDTYLGEDIPALMNDLQTSSTTVNDTVVTILQKFGFVTEQDSGPYTCYARTGNLLVQSTLYLNVTDRVCGDKCEGESWSTTICGSDCVDYTSFCHLKRSACLSGVPISPKSFSSCKDTNKIQISDIHLSSENQVLSGTSDLDLYCKINGPWGRGKEIKWYKNGAVLTGSDGSPIIAVRLLIPDAQRKWSGKYSCFYQDCIEIVSNEIEIFYREKEKATPMSSWSCQLFGSWRISDSFPDGDEMKSSNSAIFCRTTIAKDCGEFKWTMYGLKDKCLHAGPGSQSLCLVSVVLFYLNTKIEIGPGSSISVTPSNTTISLSQKLGDELLITHKIEEDKLLITEKREGETLLISVENTLTLVWDTLGLHFSVISHNTTSRICGVCGTPLSPGEVSQPRSLPETRSSHLETTLQYERDSKITPCQLNFSAVPTTYQEYLCGLEKFRTSAVERCEEVLYRTSLANCRRYVDPIPYLQKCVFDICSLPSFHLQLVLCKIGELFRVRCQAEGVGGSPLDLSELC